MSKNKTKVYNVIVFKSGKAFKYHVYKSREKSFIAFAKSRGFDYANFYDADTRLYSHRVYFKNFF